MFLTVYKSCYHDTCIPGTRKTSNWMILKWKIQMFKYWFKILLTNTCILSSVHVYKEMCIDIDRKRSKSVNVSKFSNFCFWQNYLCCVPEIPFWNKLSSRSLLVETGRCISIQLSPRECTTCCQSIQAEFHFILVCVRNIRSLEKIHQEILLI